MKLNKMNKGFTLIEILVVITIIGLLVSISFIGVTRAREKAAATKVVAQFEILEKNLNLLSLEDNIGWWAEDDEFCAALTGCANGADPDISVHTGLTNVPKPPLASPYYRYDNDGDDYYDGPDNSGGVNIILYFPNSTTNDRYFLMLETIIDGYSINENSGKLRRQSNGNIVYNIVAKGN